MTSCYANAWNWSQRPILRTTRSNQLCTHAARADATRTLPKRRCIMMRNLSGSTTTPHSSKSSPAGASVENAREDERTTSAASLPPKRRTRCYRRARILWDWGSARGWATSRRPFCGRDRRASSDSIGEAFCRGASALDAGPATTPAMLESLLRGDSRPAARAWSPPRTSRKSGTGLKLFSAKEQRGLNKKRSERGPGPGGGPRRHDGARRG